VGVCPAYLLKHTECQVTVSHQTKQSTWALSLPKTYYHPPSPFIIII